MPGENTNDNQQQQQQQQQQQVPPAGQQQQQAPAGGQTNDALAAAIAQLTQALGQPKGQEDAVTLPGTRDIAGTGDEVLDGIVQSVSLAYPKLDLDRAVGKAIESGDARFIDAAYIRDVAGKDADRLLKIAAAAVARVNESAGQLKSAVYDTVGGEANWNTAVAAFNQSAPAELKAAVATMLDSGKSAQVKAAAQLVSQFASAGGFIRSSEGRSGAAYAAATGGQGLSKAEFQAELAKLDRNSRDFREQREQLFNRRALGQKAGL